jgi:hypothetical protein
MQPVKGESMKKIVEIINEIPINFFHDWQDGLRDAYKAAARNVYQSEYEYPQASNMLPYSFNAHSDQRLKEIARQYSCFDIRDAKNVNGYYFTIISTKNIIIDSQNASASPRGMIEYPLILEKHLLLVMLHSLLK